MQNIRLGALSLALAVSPLALGDEALVRWSVAQSASAPVVLQSVRPVELAVRGPRTLAFTLQNVSDFAIADVRIVGRVFTPDGRRKGAFAIEEVANLAARETREFIHTSTRLDYLEAADTLVATIGAARYGLAGARQEWRLRQGELLKLGAAESSMLVGETIASMPSPDLACAICESCSNMAGLCGYKQNPQGQCNRPGCVLSMSCSRKDWECSISCSGSDACC